MFLGYFHFFFSLGTIPVSSSLSLRLQLPFWDVHKWSSRLFYRGPSESFSFVPVANPTERWLILNNPQVLLDGSHEPDPTDALLQVPSTAPASVPSNLGSPHTFPQCTHQVFNLPVIQTKHYFHRTVWSGSGPFGLTCSRRSAPPVERKRHPEPSHTTLSRARQTAPAEPWHKVQNDAFLLQVPDILDLLP